MLVLKLIVGTGGTGFEGFVPVVGFGVVIMLLRDGQVLFPLFWGKGVFILSWEVIVGFLQVRDEGRQEAEHRGDLVL